MTESQQISRREARRAAVFMLYQWDVTETPLGSLYEDEVDDYTRRLAEAVSAHAPELDARITAASDEWTADRLGAVERNILRVAIEELDEGEIPHRGRARRGGDAGEALRIRRGGQTRQRHSRQDRQGGGAREQRYSSEESLSRAEELLARLEAARGELEQLSEQEDASPERALEILNELSELAKAVEEELERAKRAAEADAAQS